MDVVEQYQDIHQPISKQEARPSLVAEQAFTETLGINAAG